MIGFRCAPGAEDPLETGATSSAGFREKNNQILSVLLHSEIIHKSYNSIYVSIYIYLAIERDSNTTNESHANLWVSNTRQELHGDY